jgi:hypothetical protein
VRDLTHRLERLERHLAVRPPEHAEVDRLVRWMDFSEIVALQALASLAGGDRPPGDDPLTQAVVAAARARAAGHVVAPLVTA